MREGIDSLLSQTFSDLELIICDNASDDGSTDVALEYARADSRVRYFRNAQNLGALPNFNKTFRLARGEYFRWASCNDVCLPEYLARCVEVLDARPEVVLVYPLASLIDDEGKMLDPSLDPLELDMVNAARRLHHLIWHLGAAHPVYGLARTRVLAQTHLMPSMKRTDWILLSELALLGPFHQTNEMLFLARKMNEDAARHRNRYWFDANPPRVPVWGNIRLTSVHIQAVRASSLPQAQKWLLCADVIARFVFKDHDRIVSEIKSILFQGHGVRPWLRRQKWWGRIGQPDR